MKSFFLYNFFILLMYFVSQQAFGQDFSATVVTKIGNVKILKLAKPTDKGPFVLYQDQKYTYKNAGIGRKVKAGNVVQCGPNGKTKIIYKNGDHMVIGEGTSLVMPVVSTSGPQKNKKSEMTLLYGKVRALVSKKGPRNNLEIKTKSAVAGVRGTDFFISSHLSGTDVTVLRGQVDIKQVDDKISTPPLKVKTGYTAKVNKITKKDPARAGKPKINASANVTDLEITSKEKLLQVQTESTLNTATSTEKELKEDVQLEIKKLNKKSVEIVLEDIKAEDPELFKKIKDKKPLDSNEIHTEVVAKLFKKAPSKKVKIKITSDEVDALGKDVYKKYFDLGDD